MTRSSGGPTIDNKGASGPTKDERDRELAGIDGDAPDKAEKPSPAGRGRGETSAGDGQPPIDLDTVRDRAS